MVVFEFEKNGKIAVFTLNRPEKHNAITPQMFREMEEAMHRFLLDPDLWVGVVTGAGEKAFCSGADIVEWFPFAKQALDQPWLIPDTPMRGIKMTKPLIAAVNGIAYGGGAEIALSCDLRVAAENARFRFPEPGLGILPRLGGTQRLPRLIGKARALEMLLTNEIVDAPTALEIGLVNAVTPQDRLMDTAFSYAEKICSLAPLAVRSIKRCVDEGLEMTLEEGLALESEVGKRLYQTRDYEEGRAAFREKRKPVFTGE